jgi:hypothetical protein
MAAIPVPRQTVHPRQHFEQDRVDLDASDVLT